MEKPIIKITMENGEVMTAELYPEIAPKTVENFLKLIKSGFYNGLGFHRVIEGFMIQGGCPKGDGTGGPGWTIPGEFSQNGVKNDLLHTEGVLSMARTSDPNSAGSQFFIMTETSPHLDGAYAAFGKLTSGLETLHKIERCRTPRTEIYAGKSQSEITDSNGKPVFVHQGNADTPLDPQKIKTITVEEAEK